MLSDVLGLLGLVLLTIAAAAVTPAAGLAVAGAACLWLSLSTSRKGRAS